MEGPGDVLLLESDIVRPRLRMEDFLDIFFSNLAEVVYSWEADAAGSGVNEECDRLKTVAIL
jgi:hypothetical protein